MNFIFSIYEKLSLLHFCPTFLRRKYEHVIWLGKLNLDPEDIFGSSLIVFLLGFLLSIIISFINRDISLGIFLTSITFFIYLTYYPIFYEKVLQISVVSESVWVVLFLVLYLKRNPNLERAFSFVAHYWKGILPSDFDEIIYHLRQGKYATLREAIEEYSKRWIELNPDFVYVINLLTTIENIPDERRIHYILDKALNWIIKRSYQKSKKYSLEMRTPARIILSFLIMMPLIFLIMLPIVSVFLLKQVSLSFIFYGYLVLLPFLTFMLLQLLLSKRPFAFSNPDLSLVPDLPPNGFIKIGRKLVPILPICLIVFTIIALPGIFHLIDLVYKLLTLPPEFVQSFMESEYKISNVIITYTFVFGLGLSIGLYFYLSSFIKIRKIRELEEMEEELPIALYEIGNFLAEGKAIEVVFYKAYMNYRVSKMNGKMDMFFRNTIINLHKGLTLKEAIFDPKIGTLKYYPSKLVREVLVLIVTSANKGIDVLMYIVNNVAKHLENINDTRYSIQELLSDVTQTLRVSSKIFIPFIGSIVMVFQKAIIEMLWKIANVLKVLDSMMGTHTSAGLYSIFKQMFNLDKVLPPTLFLVIVGVYTIEAVILTSYFAVGIDKGFDPVSRDYEIGTSLIQAMFLLTILVLGGLALVSSIFGNSLSTVQS